MRPGEESLWRGNAFVDNGDDSKRAFVSHNLTIENAVTRFKVNQGIAHLEWLSWVRLALQALNIKQKPKIEVGLMCST